MYIQIAKTLESSKWVMQNLVVNNPEYESKRRLSLWLGNTPKTLDLFIQRGENYILPYGTKHSIPFKYQIPVITEIPIEFQSELSLYNYQCAAVNSIKGKDCGVIVGKAGCGKTQVGIGIIESKKVKTLWLTHTSDLLTQSKNRIQSYLNGCSIGEITDGKVNIQDITVATVQTLSKVDLSELKNEFTMIIVDECHRVAGTPNKITMFSKVLNRLNYKYCYGLTATPTRADGLIRCMFTLVGEVIHTIETNNTIKADIHVIKSGLEVNYLEYIDTDGTVIYSKYLNSVSYSNQRNHIIAQLVNNCKEEITIILSDRIKQLEMLKTEVGFGEILVGKVSKKQREDTINRMRTGELKTIYATYQLVKEGLDIPNLARLIMASPIQDDVSVIQSVGRVERVCECKNTPIVYDIVDTDYLSQKMLKKRVTIYNKNGNKVIKC